MKFTDQLGNTFKFSSPPVKIISLVPSQTELLNDLGLDKEIVGITDYCVHPKLWKEHKNKIGGTKKLDIEKIKGLKPDLIIGNKEENEKSQIEELMKEFPVWMSDIKTLEEALEMIAGIGQITGKEKKALEIQNNIREQFSHFKLATTGITHPASVLYLIWRKPYICAGSETFIDHMLKICGLKNAAGGTRYPEISPDEMQKAYPSLIFLSSEPFPFQQKHIQELQLICPQARILLVDGEMFSWYGSRLIFAPAYFERLLQNL